jgi:hypothetical protein
MKYEADLPHCVGNVTTTNILLFIFCCNIFIGVRIIKEMPGLVASGTTVFAPQELCCVKLAVTKHKMGPCKQGQLSWNSD